MSELPAGWSRITPPPAVGTTVMLEDGRIVCVASPSAIYDPTADRWTPTGPRVAPTVRARKVVVTAEGWVHVSGGVLGHGPDPAADCELYDPKSNTWHAMPALPKASADHAVVAVRGRVFAIGGTSAATQVSFVSWAPGESWKHLPELPKHITALRACVLDDDSIVVWGSDSLRWDHTQWSLIGPIDTAATVVPVPDGFVTIGGIAAGAVVRYWSLAKGWEPRPALPRYQKWPVAVRLRDDRIAILGGRQIKTRVELNTRRRESYEAPIAGVILQRGKDWVTLPAPEIQEYSAHVLPDGRVIVGEYAWTPPA